MKQDELPLAVLIRINQKAGAPHPCKTKQDGTSWKKTPPYIVTRSMTDNKSSHVLSNRYLFLRIQDEVNEY